jgi:hypothetical protein
VSKFCRIYFAIRDQSRLEDECYEWAHENSPAPFTHEGAHVVMMVMRQVIEKSIKDGNPMLIYYVERSETGEFIASFPLVLTPALVSRMMVWAESCPPGDDTWDEKPEPVPQDKTTVTPPAPKVPSGDDSPDPADWWKDGGNPATNQ